MHTPTNEESKATYTVAYIYATAIKYTAVLLSRNISIIFLLFFAQVKVWNKIKLELVF